jgi:hypothetical protein
MKLKKKKKRIQRRGVLPASWWPAISLVRTRPWQNRNINNHPVYLWLLVDSTIYGQKYL